MWLRCSINSCRFRNTLTIQAHIWHAWHYEIGKVMLCTWLNVTFIILKREKKKRWSIIWQALCWGKQLLKWWYLKNLSLMNVPKFYFPFTCLKKIMMRDMLWEQCLLYPPPIFLFYFFSMRSFICRFFFLFVITA